MANSSKNIRVALFVAYSVLVLWLTIGIRNIGMHDAQYSLFWSYHLWFSGDWNLGWQILANIALFIPLGLLIDKKQYLFIPVFLSISIELLQLFALRGLFEFDDILDNSLGAVVGWVIGRFLDGKIKENWRTGAGIVSVLALALVCLCTPTAENPTNYPRIICFQMDRGGNGFCFRVGNSDSCQLILEDRKTGGKRTATAKTGIERPDVAEYFGEEYRFSGFLMDIPDGEYEVLVKYNPFVSIPTGVYVGSSIHYAPEKEFSLPAIVAPFVKNGILRVYRPDYHCWVYQWNGALYWVADKDFYFEDDGSTYIEYQLWTTQTDKLPQHRLDNNWLWDNIGGNFEDYELEGEWNGYRVMKRELPTAYPITSIVTGYHKDGKWIWKEYFRPYYEFD